MAYPTPGIDHLWWLPTATPVPQPLPAAVVKTASRATNPVMVAVTRTGAELTACTSQRLQAMIEQPSRLAQCRTPHDLMTEQLRFCQVAADQYTAALRAMTSAWSTVIPGLAVWPMAATPTDIVLPNSLPRIVATSPARAEAPLAGSQRDLVTFRDPVAEPARTRKAA
jgi:hypothetical protein